MRAHGYTGMIFVDFSRTFVVLYTVFLMRFDKYAMAKRGNVRPCILVLSYVCHELGAQVILGLVVTSLSLSPMKNRALLPLLSEVPESRPNEQFMYCMIISNYSPNYHNFSSQNTLILPFRRRLEVI